MDGVAGQHHPMNKSVGTERNLETKVKGLDRVRITLVTKSCSNVRDLNWFLSHCTPNLSLH